MKLLAAKPEAPPDAPGEPAPDGTAEPGTRTCGFCAGRLEPGQDWCLRCGTPAVPLAEQPGRRAVFTVLGLTAALVAGAVAVSYAALRDAGPAPAQTATSGQVAQVPPPAATVAPGSTAPGGASTTLTPSPDTSTGDVPTVDVPTTSTATPKPKAVTPKTTTSTSTSTSASSPPPTPTSTATSTAAPTPPPSSAPAPAPSTPTTTPAPNAPVAMTLGPRAGSMYDPYRRATRTGVAGNALDGKRLTAWFVQTPADGAVMGLGYTVDLGRRRGIRAIEISSTTPGFRVEVYASDGATPPPNILDSRWAHLTDKGGVGERPTTRIVVGGGTSKYRTLLLWITKPPTAGPYVRISELRVFG